MLKKYLPLLILVQRLLADSFIGAPIPEGCSYLPPNRPCIFSDTKLHQGNVYAGLDFLYWQGGMDGLEYAFTNIVNPTIGSVSLEQKGSVKRLHFEWEPAVRVLLGYHLPYDNWWNLDFAFTYYHTTVDDHAQQTFPLSGDLETGLLPVWTSPSAFQLVGPTISWTDASAHWNFKAYIYDLMLRHSLCISSALSIEPAFGLKMATLQQYYKVQYAQGPLQVDNQEFLSSDIGMKCRSFNFGPEVALATQWRFGGHWNLFGAISAALFGSSFATSRDESDTLYSFTQTAPFTDLFRLHDDFWTLRPQSALQLGLNWGDCICRKESVISYGFFIAYEAQYFWKQNMLLRYVDGLFLRTQVAPTQGDLFLHGLTVNAHIDF